jgi:hypothetical protein
MRPLAALVELAHRAGDPRVVLYAMVCGLVLGALALSAFSFFALLRAKALVRAAEQRARAGQERCEALLESLRESQDLLSAELHEIRDQPPIAVNPASPKPGLNLTTRSQALRMHRRGDPPDRIAASLNIPLQEVDLLLKVHRIVISNI